MSSLLSRSIVLRRRVQTSSLSTCTTHSISISLQYCTCMQTSSLSTCTTHSISISLQYCTCTLSLSLTQDEQRQSTKTRDNTSINMVCFEQMVAAPEENYRCQAPQYNIIQNKNLSSYFFMHLRIQREIHWAR
jgi:hypothetical protein